MGKRPKRFAELLPVEAYLESAIIVISGGKIDFSFWIDRIGCLDENGSYDQINKK